MLDKSPWDSNAVFIVSVISGFPHKTVQPFEIFLLFSHKVEIGKKLLDIHVQRCLWGEGRVGPV